MGAKVTVDNYAMKRCEGCCVCEGGSKNIARICVIALLAMTVIGLAILPFFKKCTVCGHNMFMNEHQHSH